MAIKNNCYKCDKREIGCHLNCENYIKYRKELDVINNRRKYIKFIEQIGRCRYGKTKFE